MLLLSTKFRSPFQRYEYLCVIWLSTDFNHICTSIFNRVSFLWHHLPLKLWHSSTDIRLVNFFFLNWIFHRWWNVLNVFFSCWNKLLRDSTETVHYEKRGLFRESVVCHVHILKAKHSRVNLIKQLNRFFDWARLTQLACQDHDEFMSLSFICLKPTF